MSNFTTSINNNININSYLKSSPQIKNKKIFESNQTQKNNIKKLQIPNIKKIFNCLNYTKLKGRKKYCNYNIFSIKEKKVENKKLKLKLNSKKNLSLSRKNDKDINSQSSIYITKNLSEGNFSQLPKLLELLGPINDNKHKRSINNNRNKFKGKHALKKNKSETSKTSQVKFMLLDKIKNRMERQNETEIIINKVNSNILTKKINSLNIYRTPEYFFSTYIERVRAFLTQKKMRDVKKERLLEFEEITQNKLKLVKEQINSMRKSQRLFDNNFKIKCQEYILSLYKDIEKQKKKDIILTNKIYELKRDVLVLEKKVNKLFEDKKTYIKWILFQIQVKNKLLNNPKEYQEYLENQNKNNFPQGLKKYMENIIFPSPQDLINRIEDYENRNIKNLELYHKINNEIYPLKDLLEKELKIFNSFLKENEINNLNEIILKLKSKNQLLIEQRSSIIKMKDENIFNKKILQMRNFSKLYEKIKLMKNNIFGKGKKEKFESQLKEMLNILKKIEIEIDIQKKKYEFYNLKCKDKLKMAEEKIEKEKRKEKIKKNRNMVIEKQIQIRENIIEKTKKQFLFPNKKINWTVFNIKKIHKKKDNEDNKNEFLKRNNNGYLIYE